MSDGAVPTWKCLTNHAHVLVCIANDPGVRLRDIGQQVGITERAAHRIVTELGAAGYITRERNGRRNYYTINSDLPVHDPIAREQSIGRLLQILTTLMRIGPRENSITSHAVSPTTKLEG